MEGQTSLPMTFILYTPHRQSFKQVTATGLPDGRIKLTSFNPIHFGHDCVPVELSGMFPANRRLTPVESAKVIFYRDCQLQRRQIIQVLQEECQRYIHPKDVSNAISYRSRLEAEGRNQVLSLVKAVEESSGWKLTVGVSTCSPTQPKLFFLCHASMISNF